MEYAEFEVEYKRVTNRILHGDHADLTADIAHLRALAERIDDEDDRDDARLEVEGLEIVDASDPGEPPSEIIMRAREVYAEAGRYDGTPGERLARAEEGMRELSRISADASPDEKAAIGALEHTLQMVIGGLQIDLR